MMNANSKIDFRKTSLVLAIIYGICASALLVIYTETFAASTRWLGVATLCAWITGPQFILFQYVSRFMTRWARLISLLLQIALFSALYNYSIPAFFEYDDIKYETVFTFLPIWHYVIVATAGFIMKIIQSY